MKNLVKYLMIALLLGFGLAACEPEQGAIEDAGTAVEGAVEDVGTEVEDAGEVIEEEAVGGEVIEEDAP